jgi:hypothetical protein
MQLRCKKPITYHWGSQYVEGKDYLVIDEVNNNISIITDYHNYYNDCKLIASSGKHLHLSQDLENLLPGYNQAIENSKCKKYESKVTLPFFKIQNEEGRYATFCILTHKEISELYGVELIDGEVSFTTTIDMADEYFDMTQYNRERKLGYLGIK